MFRKPLFKVRHFKHKIEKTSPGEFGLKEAQLIKKYLIKHDSISKGVNDKTLLEALNNSRNSVKWIMKMYTVAILKGDEQRLKDLIVTDKGAYFKDKKVEVIMDKKKGIAFQDLFKKGAGMKIRPPMLGRSSKYIYMINRIKREIPWRKKFEQVIEDTIDDPDQTIEEQLQDIKNDKRWEDIDLDVKVWEQIGDGIMAIIALVSQAHVLDWFESPECYKVTYRTAHEGAIVLSIHYAWNMYKNCWEETARCKEKEGNSTIKSRKAGETISFDWLDQLEIERKELKLNKELVDSNLESPLDFIPQTSAMKPFIISIISNIVTFLDWWYKNREREASIKGEEIARESKIVTEILDAVMKDLWYYG